jgi:hypothetical protein
MIKIGIDFGNLNGFLFGEPIYGFESLRSTFSFNSLPALKNGSFFGLILTR